jgi:hypothetical protein
VAITTGPAHADPFLWLDEPEIIFFTFFRYENMNRMHSLFLIPVFTLLVGWGAPAAASETVTTGEIVIPPQFENARVFSGGLAAVRVGEPDFFDKANKKWIREAQWGYIDKTGKIVIPPQFERADDFLEGLARVYLDGKSGCIDKTGKIVSDGPCEFPEGLAVARRGDKYGYIDKTGEFVIQPQFEHAGNFSEGLAGVSWEYGRKQGVIDKTGKMLFQSQVGLNDPSLSGPFKEGLARVSRIRAVPMSDSARLCGYMDRTGKIVIPLQFHSAGDFSEGLAAVSKNSRGGYIDKTGKTVIPLQFGSVRNFSEGLAFVNLGPGGKYGYIDKTGKVVIQLQVPLGSGYRESGFSEGLARVLVQIHPTGKYPYKYGYIDKTGEIVIQPQFDDAGDFSEGLAPVRLNGKWGYVSR